MNKIMIMVALFFVLFAPNFAQAQVDDRIVVRRSELPPVVVAEVEAKNKAQQIQQYAGVGKEVSIAINEGLAAVTEHTSKFSDTKVGFFTMALIAYKVVGRDFVHYVVGASFFVIMLPLWIWSYRKTCLPNRLIVKDIKSADKSRTLEYTTTNGGSEAVYMVHYVLLIAIVVTTMITTFSR